MSFKRDSNALQNPAYFNVLELVTPEDALQTLGEVAESVRQTTGSKRKRRKSFKELLSSSLGGGGGRKSKKNNCKRRSREDSGGDHDLDERMASLVRSASLLDDDHEQFSGSPAEVLPLSTSSPVSSNDHFESRRNANSSNHQQQQHSRRLYYNESVAGAAVTTVTVEDKPPRPPERNQSSLGVGVRGQSQLRFLPSQFGNFSGQKRSFSMSAATHRKQEGNTDDRSSSSRQVMRKQPQLQPLAAAPLANTGGAPLGLPRHVFHPRCRLQDLEEQQRSAVELLDIVILYSGRCRVSGDWGAYLRRLFSRYTVRLLEIEDLSSLVAELLSVGGESAEKRLAVIEESLRHASAQVIVLGPDMLSWITRYPGLAVGGLLDEEHLLCLLLGVDAAKVHSEHRATLPTFPAWRKIPVVANSHAFAEKIFGEVTSIVEKTANSLRTRRGTKDRRPGGENVPIVVTPGEKGSPPYLTAVKGEKMAEVKKQETCVSSALSNPSPVLACPDCQEHLLKVRPRKVDKAEQTLFLLSQGQMIPRETKTWLLPQGNREKEDTKRKIRLPESYLERLNDLTLGLTLSQDLFVTLKGGSTITGVDIVIESPDCSFKGSFVIGHGNDSKIRGSFEVHSQPFALLQGGKPEQLSSIRTHLQAPVEADSRDNIVAEDKDSIRDIPRQKDEGTSYEKSMQMLPIKACSSHFYIPMKPATGLSEVLQKNTTTSSSFLSSSSSNLRRTCSASVVYVPPSNLKVSSSPTSHGDVGKSTSEKQSSANLLSSGQDPSLEHLLTSNPSPQSRQEILHHLNNSKPVSDEETKDGDSSKAGEEEKAGDDLGFSCTSLPEFSAVAGFLPFPPPSTRHQSFSSPSTDCFESCQRELVELQEQFKRDVLTLREVEERFERWKRRADVGKAHGRRQVELQTMRTEWARLQQLAAERTSTESRVWAAFRGLLRKGIRRKKESVSKSPLVDNDLNDAVKNQEAENDMADKGNPEFEHVKAGDVWDELFFPQTEREAANCREGECCVEASVRMGKEGGRVEDYDVPGKLTFDCSGEGDSNHPEQLC